MMQKEDECVRCAKCEASVRKADLEEHVMDDLNYFPIRCYLCDWNFLSEQKLQNHFDYRHAGKKARICVTEDYKLEDACKEWIKKSLEGMDISQGTTERNDGGIIFKNSSHESGIEEEGTERSGVERSEMASVQENVQEPTVEEELFEKVIKEEFFNVDECFPQIQDSAKEGEEKVHVTEMDRNKKDGEGSVVFHPRSTNDGTVDAKDKFGNVPLDKITQEFYAAVRRVQDTEKLKKREVSCALCKWTQPDGRDFMRNITRHVYKHLAKLPFSCSECRTANIGWITHHYNQSHPGTKTPSCDKNFTPGVAEEMLDTLLKCFHESMAKGDDDILEAGKDTTKVEDANDKEIQFDLQMLKPDTLRHSSPLVQKLFAARFKKESEKNHNEPELHKSSTSAPSAKRSKKETEANESGPSTSKSSWSNKSSGSDCGRLAGLSESD